MNRSRNPEPLAYSILCHAELHDACGRPLAEQKFGGVCHCHCHQSYSSNISGRNARRAIWAAVGEMWKYSSRTLTDAEIEHVIRFAATESQGEVSEEYIWACIKVAPAMIVKDYLSLSEFEDEVDQRLSL